MIRNSDNSMNICLLTRYFDLRNAGIGRFSMEMLNGLKSRGHAVKTIGTNGTGKVGYFIYTGMEIPFQIPHGYDVYHALTPMESIYIPKNRGIITFHDLIPIQHLKNIDTHYVSGSWQAPKRFISSHYFKFACDMASRCAIVVCTSQLLYDEIRKYLHVPESKIKIISYGINSLFGPALKPDKVYRIGTLSYLDKRKRIDLLIKGFREANVDGELVIAGMGPDEERLRELADGDERIKFCGFVAEDKVPDFYNSLDMFVFPTRVEGYGLPIIEAFACKKPVVVMRDGYMPEEIKTRCTVVDDLGGFLKNQKLNCDIESNYLFAKRHSWDRCIEEYIALYKQLG